MISDLIGRNHVSEVMSPHNPAQLIEVDGLVGELHHADAQTLVDALLVGVRAEGDNAALVLLVVVFKDLEDFSGGVKTVHNWHLDVH